jgi:hypothetical protein
MSRLNSGNACYHAVLNLLSSHLPSKTSHIKTYKTMAVPVVLDGCDTWSLMLKEEHKVEDVF